MDIRQITDAMATLEASVAGFEEGEAALEDVKRWFRFSPSHAALIVTIYDIDRELANPDEVSSLEMRNPDLLDAYRALVEYAKQPTDF